MEYLRGGKTGWPPGLLQDDSQALFRWFADRLGSRFELRRVLSQN